MLNDAYMRHESKLWIGFVRYHQNSKSINSKTYKDVWVTCLVDHCTVVQQEVREFSQRCCRFQIDPKNNV